MIELNKIEKRNKDSLDSIFYEVKSRGDILIEMHDERAWLEKEIYWLRIDKKRYL